MACGDCQSCHLFEVGNHPDYLHIAPEEEGRQIKVEQVRSLIDFIVLKSQYQQYKIATIASAHCMNRSSANTLLKTLEEPPENSLIMLLTDRPHLLPITIRSRCQRINFSADYSKETINWLEHKLTDPGRASELLRFTDGAPLAALNIADSEAIKQRNKFIQDLAFIAAECPSPVIVAEDWNKIGAEQSLKWLLDIFSDMIRLKINAPSYGHYDEESADILHQLINHLDLDQLMRCHDLILDNYGLAAGQVSYNMQGLLEDFVIFWQEFSKSED